MKEREKSHELNKDEIYSRRIGTGYNQCPSEEFWEIEKEIEGEKDEFEEKKAI